VLRDDGMSYGDYVEQLTYLLFLKMADERSAAAVQPGQHRPGRVRWPSLLAKDGDELFDHYRHCLEALGQHKGTLGLIFGKAQNKFQDPAKLRRLVVDLIDAENWTALGVDVKGDAYEGLLEKNAQDTKSGAGQYFTPRALIQAMVDCIAPKPARTICDPACGTGGFLFMRTNHIVAAATQPHARREALPQGRRLHGLELVQATARVCAMNLLLHGIGSEKSVPVKVTDALAADPGERYDVVLANPPFGKKSSTVIVGEDGRATSEKDIIERDDFWATTSNKQLNFVQHIKTLLKMNGRAAVVLPDNVLFEGGAGETIRRKLLHECDVHTLLRLPTGIFYAQGVKANVLFFDKKPASETPWTKKLWIYDLRTNKHFTLKTNPSSAKTWTSSSRCTTRPTATSAPGGDVEPESNPTRPLARATTYAELVARDKASLDIFWLKDERQASSAWAVDSDNLPSTGGDRARRSWMTWKRRGAGAVPGLIAPVRR
jgi:type I restriction enzyme M protein